MQEKTVLLVGVCSKQDSAFAYTMIELANLAQACGYRVVCEITQKLEHTKMPFYIGKGKLAEIVDMVEQEGIDAVLFNDELTPSQLKRISELLKCDVLDRTMLILEIFASHTKTKEAQLQVEISKLQYQLPRLVNQSDDFDRQGGGSGLINRGEGESKLELTRRQIEAKIAKKSRELTKMVQERKTQRTKRNKSQIKSVALVGYTNVGKSSLMNALICDQEEKQVFVKDMLFATLETRVRRIKLHKNYECLLSDTVGFIDKLPHHLVKAFRSTLEEVKEADILLHVIDISNPYYKQQKQITLQTLEAIGIKEIPIINVYNKIDLVDFKYSNTNENLYISTTNNIGIEAVKQTIIDALFHDYIDGNFLFPYDASALVSKMNETYDILLHEYVEQGIHIIAKVPKSFYERYKDYQY